MDSDYLAELFEPVGRVMFRRMFGGHGIFRDGLMFGLVTGEQIYLKVDAATEAAFVAEGSEPFRYARKGSQSISLGYWRLPERLLDEPDELREWALGAVAASQRAAAAKSAKPAKPAGRRKSAGRKGAGVA